jgi:hypothetical protein
MKGTTENVHLTVILQIPQRATAFLIVSDAEDMFILLAQNSSSHKALSRVPVHHSLIVAPRRATSRTLMEHGVNVNAQNRYRTTPLLIILDTNKLEVVEMSP